MKGEKSNKSLIILVVIFALTTLVLGGHVAYDKFVSSNDKKSDEVICNNSNVSINLNQLEKYKNYNDNSYGTIDYYYSNEIRVYLTADGKVKMIKDGEETEKNITNLENVIDILEVSYFGDVNYYFLLKNGDVYNYDLDNYESNIFTASKNENASNIQRILSYSYAPAAATEYDNLVIGVTNTGENIIIK